MSKTDGKHEAEPGEGVDPLSATAMFLNAYNSHQNRSEATELTGEEGAESALGQRTEPLQDTRKQDSPGEFTRLFVQSTPAPPTGAVRVPSPPPSPPRNTSRLKGVSSPGASDSASADGAFTQIFPSDDSARTPNIPAFPAAAASSAASEPGVFTQLFQTEPSPRVDRASAMASPLSSNPPQASDEALTQLFEVGQVSHSPVVAEFTPFPPTTSPSSGSPDGSFTQLFETDRSPRSTPIQSSSAVIPASHRKSSEWTPDLGDATPGSAPDGISSERGIPPFYSSDQRPPRSSDPSPQISGGVTQLIHLLSDTALRESSSAVPTPSTSVDFPEALVATGPGELTRMLSPETIKAAAVAPQTPPLPTAQPHPSVSPAAIMPQKPQPPRIEAPQVAEPRAVAVATPKNKLQELVPLLLVLNAFLTVVLIVVVVFALRAK